MTPSLFSFGRKRQLTDSSSDEGAGVESLEEALGSASSADDSGPGGTDSSSGEDPAPADLVVAALESWRRELIDLGGSAGLDDLTTLEGVVDLSAAHPSGLAQLYAGRPTHLTSLIRERSALGVARQSLRDVAGRTDRLARQFGVAPIYLAIGAASWTDEPPSAHGTEPQHDPGAGDAAPSGTARTLRVPVLLRPVRLSSATADAALTLDPSIEVNPVLVRALRRHGATADVDAAARATLSHGGFSPRTALSHVEALGRQHLPGFEVHEQQVIGAFVHPGQALVEDLDDVWDRARASALVAAIAGDQEARAALRVALGAPDPADRAPSEERGAGDLDPAQLDAVEAVGTGASLLLDAPPGSDVATTLAAVLADAAASGRTVLHVPATSADGHAVAGALRDLGLGDLVLDLTEDGAWRQHVAEGIKEALGVEPPELDVARIVKTREHLELTRERLARYVSALHVRREPWGVSVRDSLEQLAVLTAQETTRTSARVEAGRLELLDEEGRVRARQLLARAHGLGVLTKEAAHSPWRGIAVADIDEATDTLVRLQRLSDELLPVVRENSTYVSTTTGIARPTSVRDWCDQLTMLDGVRESLDIFLPAVFERSAADMVIATASKKWREDRSIQMTGADRRRYARSARDLVRPGRAVDDLHAELVKVQQRRETWRGYDPEGGWPRLPHGLDEMQATASQARDLLDRLQPVVGSAPDAPVLTEMPLDRLLDRIEALSEDDSSVQRLPEVNRVLGGLDELGLTPLVADLAEREVPAEELDDELTFSWWSSFLAQALRGDPDLEGLDAQVLTELSSTLRQLDAEQSASLAGPVRHACARRVRAAVEEDKEDARALYVALSREGGAPLRDTIALYPVALVAKPVWIVPPTLVPEVLAPDTVIDVAVLDASADVPVARVVPAFVRAAQVIVVGDPRRSETGLAAELGALLPSVTLPTSRNTLDAEIAAFLAANGYEDVVEAVPAPPGTERLSLELVDGRGMPAPGQSAVETVGAEVERVVDLIIEHALTRPEQSLGVIALNARHAEAVRRAVAAAVSGSLALEEFFATGLVEPFTVVDLTEARSLRRDHVILTVGYAKTPHGRTIHSFGAVSGRSGMVELVEALCASRGRTQVVSCLSAQDIDSERLHAPGARLLREVLERAGGRVEDAGTCGEEVPDRLLEDLVAALRRRGLNVVVGYGLDGGLRLPLAVGHPSAPEELVVAVLTDDEEYVAEPSLRRRDRHWVERLERRGWSVYRAFSAGVFIDPAAEAARVADLVDQEMAARSAAAEGPEAEMVPEDVDDAEPTSRQDASEGPTDAETGTGVVASAGEGTGDASGVTAPPRLQRPSVAQGLPLQAYSDDQLDDLLTWIRSDGVERTPEEEIEELREALALRRRGAGITAVLGNVVRRPR